MPLLWVYPNEVAFQVPWEVTGTPALEIQSNTDSPFEQFSGPTIVNGGYWFWSLPAPNDRSGYGLALSIAAHEGFDSLIVPDNPAHPGEIIHLYATNVGPVAPAVPTGQSAPAEPLSRVIEPVTCRIVNALSSTSLNVLYAGLAPGLTGIYQLSVQIPNFSDSAQVPYGHLAEIQCLSGANSNGLALVAIGDQ